MGSSVPVSAAVHTAKSGASRHDDGCVGCLPRGPIGGVLRFATPGVSVAGIGTSEPTPETLFMARRTLGGVRTAAAVRSLERERAVGTSRLMSKDNELEEVDIPLNSHGQHARYIEEVFTRTDTTDFVGSVRWTVLGEGISNGVTLEMDTSNQVFTTLPVVPIQTTNFQE